LAAAKAALELAAAAAPATLARLIGHHWMCATERRPAKIWPRELRLLPLPARLQAGRGAPPIRLPIKICFPSVGRSSSSSALVSTFIKLSQLSLALGLS